MGALPVVFSQCMVQRRQVVAGTEGLMFYVPRWSSVSQYNACLLLNKLSHRGLKGEYETNLF